MEEWPPPPPPSPQMIEKKMSNYQTAQQEEDLAICSNKRGITLLSVAGKVVYVFNQLKDTIDTKWRENQASIRPGRFCADQVISLRQIIEKCLVFQTPININCIESIVYIVSPCNVHRNCEDNEKNDMKSSSVVYSLVVVKTEITAGVKVSSYPQFQASPHKTDTGLRLPPRLFEPVWGYPFQIFIFIIFVFYSYSYCKVILYHIWFH